MAGWLSHFFQDLRFGARNLGRERGFAVVAIGSLALGIGGSTAMYSVIHAVILDPFPYRDAERLVSVGVVGDRGGNGGSYPIDQFLDIAERNTVFSGTIASTWSDITWTGDGEPRRLRGNHCTMNTFEVMGVPPLIGRVTLPSDAAEGAEPVTVLGYRFWQRQFASDPGVLGRKLRLNDKVRTIVGVMPERFMWRGADVYLPDVFHRGATVEGEKTVHLLARLKPGIGVEQASAGLQPLFQEIQHRVPDAFPKQWKLRVRTFAQTFPSGIQDALWILFGAVGVLLVISCVNVSNLLLSRAAYRRREIAIRASLGASRGRVVRQLLAESVLLGLCGGAAGVLLAVAGLRGIVAAVPPGTIPDEAKIALNLPVLAFAVAVSLGAAFAFGLAPALHLSGRGLMSQLKEAGRGVSGGVGQKLTRGALVVAEVALSLTLLAGASLMIRSLVSIQGARLRFHPDRILTLRLPLSEQRYPDVPRRNAFLGDLLSRMESLPGVLAVGVNAGLPPVWNWNAPVTIAGSTQADTRPVLIQMTNPGYPAVMGIPLVSGRFLTKQDVAGRLHYAAVNQAFARQYLAGQEALERVVHIPLLRRPPLALEDDAFQVVGVVGDTVNRVATAETVPEVFLPYTIVGRSDRIFALVSGQPGAFEKVLKAQVYAVDGGQPVMEVQPLEALLRDNAYAAPRFNLLLFAIFAGLGMALALSGIYGVISQAVAQQTREIGIRIALGAGFGDVVGMILRGAAALLACGIVVGLAASVASAKLLAGLARNVSAFDPYSFAAVTILLFATGILAALRPSLRAARVDPVMALRDQ